MNVSEDLSFEDLMYREIYKNFLECNATVLHKPYPKDGELYCNATFDGYLCWDYAKAGSRTYGKCPSFFVYQFGQHHGLPYKDCNVDGTWYTHPETQRPWSNYAPCSDTQLVKRAKTVMYVYFSGYSLSVVSLVLAMVIFACFRQLKCSRVTIHKHLFMSYILTALLWISYYAATALDPVVLAENPIWCRVLHVTAQYVTLCNYAWMFCEGFYLYSILVWTFSNDKNLLITCYFFGWGFPLIPSIIYSILRATDSKTDNGCWHNGTDLIWIFSGLVITSLVVNLFFLVNILRIFCSKVKCTNQQESSLLRQSVRAILILIPLLGIQYLLLPFRPTDTDENGEFIYDIISASLTSFQGFLVSILFCFLNGEVLFLIQNQVTIVKRRMSRSETGKSFLYSTAVPDGRKRSTQCVTYRPDDCDLGSPEENQIATIV